MIAQKIHQKLLLTSLQRDPVDDSVLVNSIRVVCQLRTQLTQSVVRTRY